MADRIRTGDRLDHNQELYQLSYSHLARLNLPGGAAAGRWPGVVAPGDRAVRAQAMLGAAGSRSSASCISASENSRSSSSPAW